MGAEGLWEISLLPPKFRGKPKTALKKFLIFLSRLVSWKIEEQYIPLMILFLLNKVATDKPNRIIY